MLATLGSIVTYAHQPDAPEMHRVDAERVLESAHVTLTTQVGTPSGRRALLPQFTESEGQNGLSPEAWRRALDIFHIVTDPQRRVDDSVIKDAWQILNAQCQELGINPQTIYSGSYDEAMAMLLGLPSEAGQVDKDKLSLFDSQLPQMRDDLARTQGIEDVRFADFTYRGDVSSETPWNRLNQLTRDAWAQTIALLTFPRLFARDVKQIDQESVERSVYQALTAFTRDIGARGLTQPQTAPAESRTGGRQIR
jgi:hypothetical protein